MGKGAEIVKSSKKSIFIENANKSSVFILPLIGLTDSYYGFINSYLGVRTETGVEGLDGESIYMHIKYYDEKLQGIDEFEGYTKLPNETYLYKFKLDNCYKEDYLYFIDGKYSQFKASTKDILCRAASDYRRKAQDTTIFGILYRTDERRKFMEELVGQKLPFEAELSSIVDLDSEIYDN